jgi:O-antigen ligase
LGIYQFITGIAFASKWLGMALHDPAVLGTSVVEVAGDPGERWLRAYGAFPHPNILAAYIVVAILLLIFNFSRSQIDRGSTAKPGQFFKRFILEVSCFIVLVAGLFFTFSRSAWLAFGISLIISEGLLFLKAYRRPENLQGAKAPSGQGVEQSETSEAEIGAPTTSLGASSASFKIVILSVLIFLSLGAIYFPLVTSRISGDTRLEIKSTTERLSSFQEAFSLIRDRPLLGVGIGNYTKTLYNKNPTSASWGYQPVHNIYLLILSELGIVGFGVFALFIFFFIRSHPSSAYFLLPVLSLGLFDHYLWSLYAGVALFWLTLAFSKTFSSTAG